MRRTRFFSGCTRARARRAIAVAVVWVGFTCATGTAQSWQFTRIGTEDGLSHNSVYALLADRDGFIWAGTVDGLDRYDGYEFVTFRHDPRNPQSLSSTVVDSLEEEGPFIWIGTSDGLDRLDRRDHHVSRVALRGLPILALDLDRESALWIATGRGLFIRGPGEEEIRRLEFEDPRLSAANFDAIARAPDGTVWAIATRATEPLDQVLIPIRNGKPGTPLAFDPAWGTVRALAFDSEGDLWLKPGHPAIVDRRSGMVRRNPADASQPPTEVWAVSTDRERSIWMATNAGLCHRPHAAAVAQCHSIRPRGSWLDNYVRSFVQGPGGIIWIGTYSGMYWLDPERKPFERWVSEPRSPDSLATNAVSSIYAENGRIVWAATFGGGLDRIDRESRTVTHFRHTPHDPRSIPDDIIWTLVPGNAGAIWVGTIAGLARFDPSKGTFSRTEFPSAAGPVSPSIWSLAIDPRGRIWGSGSSGLYRWDPQAAKGTKIDLSRVVPAADSAVQALEMGSNGILWAGMGPSAKLLRIDTATDRIESRDLRLGAIPLTSEGIWSIRSDARGRLWIGHGRGLSRYDPSIDRFEHWFGSDGLPGSVVYSIELDDHLRAWLGTNHGLVRFDESASPDQRFRIYDTSDGVASMEFNRDAAWQASDGELFFGGIGGLTTFRPDEIHDDPRPPSVVITRIELLGRRRNVIPWGLPRLTVARGDQPVTFEFAGFSYRNIERSRYRYLLEGFDADWVDAGTGRLARYTNVPPGDYVFRVEAANQDGVWTRQGLALPVEVQPALWQTMWFRLLALIALASLLYAMHRLRLARAIEVERLRLRIAGDLHDDLSSDLSGMSMMAELIRRREVIGSEERRQLGELQSKAIELADTLRDTAWGIHPEHDTLGALVRRMRATAEMLLGDIPYRFDFRGIEPERAIPMARRRNLYLIFKELLHNVVRHAAASRVEMSLDQQEHGRLTLSVADDGRGFDSSHAADGDGIRNIRRRARQMGARIEIASLPGRGTRVTVTVEATARSWRRFGMPFRSQT